MLDMIKSILVHPTMVAVLALGLAACGERAPARVGTPQLRAALFDTILARTQRREAFSPVKNERLGFDPLTEMRALRESVVSASTEADLYYSLARLSHARRDRHLDLYLVPGGLELSEAGGLDVWEGEATTPRQAPLKVFPDYTSDDAGYFIGDVASDPRWADLPAVGDVVVSVNGMPIVAWQDSAAAFMRHSTVIGLRWKLAEAMTQASASFPPRLRATELTLVVSSATGTESTHEVPYVPVGDLTWTGSGEPSYPGLELELRTPTYDLLVPGGMEGATPGA